MSKRLLVEPEAIEPGRAVLRGELSRYVQRVLRLGVDDTLTLCDGAGALYDGRIAHVTSSRVDVALAEPTRVARPAGPRLHLVYGLAKASATETVLQKATELGVDRITPLLCERSVAQPRDGERKRLRWLEIARQAARQCERAFVPEVDEPQPFARLEDVAAPCKLIASVELGQPLGALEAQLRGQPAEIALAVGPEGGFTRAEVEHAQRSGFAATSLGVNVLRSETAAIALTALVAFLAGRLDGVPVR